MTNWIMQVEQLNWLWSFWYSKSRVDKCCFIKSQGMYIFFLSIRWYFRCAMRFQFVWWFGFNDLCDIQVKFAILDIYGSLPFSIPSVCFGQRIIPYTQKCSFCGESKDVNTWRTISEVKRTLLRQPTFQSILFLSVIYSLHRMLIKLITWN